MYTLGYVAPMYTLGIPLFYTLGIPLFYTLGIPYLGENVAHRVSILWEK